MPIIGTYNGSIVGEKDLPTGGGGGGGGANLDYTASPSNGIVTSDTGADATIPAGSTVNASLMLPADKTKLDGIETGATANSTDAQLRNRSTHTGTQLANTISDFASTVLATVLTGLNTATNAVITSADNVLSALGKLQAQITSLGTSKENTLNSDQKRKVTISSSAPTGGSDGDIWLQYTP